MITEIASGKYFGCKAISNGEETQIRYWVSVRSSLGLLSVSNSNGTPIPQTHRGGPPPLSPQSSELEPEWHRGGRGRTCALGSPPSRPPTGPHPSLLLAGGTRRRRHQAEARPCHCRRPHRCRRAIAEGRQEEGEA
jgi:hypothetical protein